jgi:hypothetical protein
VVAEGVSSAAVEASLEPDSSADCEEEAVSDADADAVADADPLATMVTPSPAAVVVLAANKPFVVSVAESTETLLLEELMAAAADLAPAGASPPATTVTAAEATVCMVLPGSLMDPIWKGCAFGASIGHDPAGHMQEHAQPPFLAASSAVDALPAAAAEPVAEPEPATTVTAASAAEVVVAPARPAAVRDSMLTDSIDVEDEDVAAAAAEPASVPAMTVTGPPVAALATVSPLAVAFPSDPDPACALAVIIPFIEPLADSVPFSDPAITVTAAAAAPLEELLSEPPVALAVPFPSAWTVTALPTALVVVAARPPGVKAADSTAAPLDSAVAAATLSGASPSAETVTGAKAPLSAAEPSDAVKAPAISADVVSSAAIYKQR